MNRSRSLSTVAVQRADRLTPRLKRLVIDGSFLTDYRLGLPAQWLKVFAPTVDGQAPSGRAYTVRRFDPVSQQLELHCVLHGDGGAASAWAACARPGDTFEISGVHPRSGFAVDPATEHYRLFGDETALPAIGTILEALPAHARAEVFVEVEDAREEQAIEAAATVNLTWLHRRGEGQEATNPLEAAAKALGPPSGGTDVWIAGESAPVKALREDATNAWAVDRQRLHAQAYWKRGEPNFKDRGE